VVGKAARDALFLSSFRASQLPLAMATGALLSLLAVYWLARVMVRHAPASIVPVLFAASACGFGLEWTIAQSAPRAAALLVYFQTAALGPLMISTFWSLINERFDPHTAKRAVARIAGGGTLGGVLGGLAAWRVASFVQPITVLLFLTLLNALAAVGTLITRKRGVAAPSADSQAARLPPAEAVSPLSALRSTPFLRHLALLVLLGAAISALLDYVFNAQAAAAFERGQPLLSFFSLFWLAVGVLSFLLQIALGRVALEKLGLAVNIALLPGIIILGGAFGLAVPGLASAAMLRGAEAIQRNTLFRSAYELLYTPVPDEHKRATKAVIDVGFDRLGTIAGSGIALLVLFALSRGQSSTLLAVVVALGLATLPLTRKLHLGYVDTLQQGLREGAARLQLAPEIAAASGPIVADPSRPVELEREELIERVEELKAGGLSALVDGNRTSSDGADAAPARAVEGLTNPDLLATARDLLSADAERVKRALGRLQTHGPSIACAILLLAHPDHYETALEALRGHAPRITGQLLDALLDTSMDFVVRRRIPRALQTCSTQRAADGLLLGIADERFEVRYECARALVKVTDENPQIVIAEAKVVEAIQREIDSAERIAEGSAPQLDDELELDDAQALVDGLMRDRTSRSLEHMFTILSLVLEREPLRMAFRALHHQDDKHRGTALEYLDMVLPAEIRPLIWPYLGEAAPLPTARAVGDLLAELSRTEDSQVGTE
jgi:AAA family ATP:ADP antiporter